MAIEITDLHQLCMVCEDLGGRDDIGHPIKRTSFAFCDEEENAYFGFKVGISTRDLTVDIVRECLRPLPDEEIYPTFPQDKDMTIAPDDMGAYYIKRTAWSVYLDFIGTTFLPDQMIQEAQTMEFLTRHPHPNIIRYYGCRTKRGRIVGLALETFAFEHDLGFAATRPDLFKGRIDKAKIARGIRSALDHLHALGWSHNDLNPANIMIGDDGEPRLIDFGSAQPFGASLISAGTPGWCRERLFTSDRDNDNYSFSLLDDWLESMAETVEASVPSDEPWKVAFEDVPPL